MSRAELICRAFADTLGHAAVGLDDSFFDLGGTSLQAAQIVVALRGQTGFKTLKVGDIFCNDTPAKLDREMRDTPPHDAEPVTFQDHSTASSKATSAPLSVQQQAIWFAEQMLPGNFAYNTTSFVRLPITLSQQALTAALEDVIDRHPMLSASVSMGQTGPEIRTGVHTSPDVVFRDCDGYDEQQIQQMILDEGQICYDVTRDAMIKWRVYQLGARGTLLAQFEHHFVHDGWSMWQVWHDLAKLYKARSEGSAAVLPAPSGHYTDYCHWQKAWLASRRPKQDIRELAEQLQGGPFTLRFDGDEKRPAQFSHLGRTRETRLPEALATRLRAFSQAHRLTPFSVLFAAFLRFLHRQSRQSDMVIGTMVRHRNLPGLERTVGMFVNTLALRFEDVDAGDFLSFCQTVQHKLQHAQETEHLPFPMVAQHVDFPRDLSRNGLFQVCFSMNDWPDQALDFGTGSLAELKFPSNGGAKFDLDVVLSDPQNFHFLWRYYDALFDQNRIEELILMYHEGLEAEMDGAA